MQAQAILREVGPRTSREGAGAYLCRPWEAIIVQRRLVIRLTDHQIDPVDCGLHIGHASELCHH